MASDTLNAGEAATVSYMDGLTSSGTVAADSFADWQDDNPATYDTATNFTHKWDNNAAGHSLNFTSTAGTPGGTVTYAFQSGMTAVQQAAYTAVLTLWSDECNISFAPASSYGAADVILGVNSGSGTFQSTAEQAYAMVGSTAIPDSLSPDEANGHQASITFDTRPSDGFGTLGSFTDNGGYSYSALVHEVGHLVGLGHSGPYDDGNTGNAGTPDAPALQNGPYDSRMWTAMSYISPDNENAAYFSQYQYQNANWVDTVQTSSTSYTSTDLAPKTPMPLDIVAAQQLYGAPTSTALSGGQVFGFDCNITDASKIFFDFTQDVTPVLTLWDAGGGNTLDLSGYSSNSTVNLNPGTFSSVDGLTDNLGIAFGTAIDSAVGGSGNDVFTTNADSDTVTGGGGSDTVIMAGSQAAYRFHGGANGFTLTGDGVTDTLDGISYVEFDGGADAPVSTSSLAAANPATGPEPASDFDGDGKSDILFQNTNGQVAGWLMNGLSMDASAVVTNPSSAWTPVTTGDFNGDGASDILLQNADGSIGIWEMNGLSIAASGVVANPTTAWHPVATGDFNGDGKSDIVLQNTNGSVAIWTMNGLSLTGSIIVATPDPSWHAIATGDFAGTGQSDIVFQNDNGAVDVWYMNGTTLASSGIVANPGTAWHVVGTGDFYGDGKSDILFQNNDGSIDIWELNGLSIQSSGIVANPGPSWHAVSTGDYDGDGKSDILFQNDNGAVDIWEMNGLAIKSSGIVANPTVAWQTVGLGSLHFVDGTQSTGTLAATPLADDFVFTTSLAGSHVLTGFNPVEDVITLNQSQFPTYAAVQAAESTVGGSTVIALGAGDTLTIQGVLPGQLAAKNFV